MTHNIASSHMPRRAPIVAALMVATALAGSLAACTTIPQSAPFASEPSQAKKVNPINTVSEQTWWKDLGDPQLQRLMNQAFNNSPTLAIAEARLNQAQAAVSQYRAANRPQVGVSATAFDAKQSANFLYPAGDYTAGYMDYGQTTLSFNWELDFWGKNRAAIAAASSNAEAAEADAAQARLVLSTAIATAYIDLDRLWQERDLAERAVGIRTDSAKLVQDKLNNGVSNKAQDAQAQAGIFAAQADLAALDEQIELTTHLIAMLTGASPDFASTLQRPALSLNPQAFGTVPTQVNLDLIGRRPDVIAARWRAEAASAHIKQAHAAFYPNINIAAFAGFQALGVDKLFSAGSDIGQVGPALSLPLFDGGALKANLKSAESEHALAIASYNQDVLQAMQQVADTLSSQKALQARLDNSEKALAAYEDAYRLGKLRYDGGLSDYTSLLVAEQSLISQRRTVADLRSRAMTLDIALIKSLGGAYSSQNIAQN